MTGTDADMQVVLKDVHPLLDGGYPLDPEAFTNRDLRDIKRLSGVRPSEFSEAFDAMDSDLIVALAYIAIRKDKGRCDEDALWDAELGSIRLVGKENDAGPPAPPTPPNEPASDVDSTE